MRSATEYLRIEQKNVARNPRYGFEFEDIIDESERNRALHQTILSEVLFPKVAEDIIGKGLNFRQNLHHMALTLPADLREKLPMSLHSLVNETLFGLLPIGKVNACVLRHDREKTRLDSYLVMLNYGLVLRCHSLAYALTLEILEGDLTPYAGDGAPYFRNAVQALLSPNIDAFNYISIHRDWPPEIEGQFAVRSGALTSIMLQFVALHELGHIHHGDPDTVNGVRCLSAVKDETVVEYRRSQTEAKVNWPCEYAADAFAVNYLCDWEGQSSACWPNIAQVYLFFGWLEQAELTVGRPLCDYHPSPAERKRAVVQQAYALAPTGPPSDFFGFLDERIAAWTLSTI